MPPAALLLAALAAAQAGPADRVWVEGEAPTRTTFAFRTDAPARPAFAAGGRWLTADLTPDEVTRQVPAEGIAAEYDLRVPVAGRYDVWLRVGFETGRAPFRWRLDGGAWQDVAPDAATTDRMPVGDGVVVGWLRAGAGDLRAGLHTLEVRVPPPLKTIGPRTEPTALRFGLDCACLSSGPFTPNGPHRPDADWRTPADRLADRTAFDVPPAFGPRRTLDLAGLWQVTRLDSGERAEAFWRGVRVPGDLAAERPDLALCRTCRYRARVRVPADLAGRTFTLRLPSTARTATAFVNGARVGQADVPYAPFEWDVTAAVQAGAVNEIAVVIDGTGGPDRGGLLETPTLVVAGPAVIADVFVKPSVSRKQLGVAVMVRNPTAAAVEANVGCAARALASDGTPFGGEPEKTLPSQTVTVPAGASAVVTLDDAWERPRLWWPDDPHRYLLETTVTIGEQASDAVATPFGFREWAAAGGRVTLNGVPWGLRADARHADRQPGRYAIQAAQDWKRHGQTFAAFAGEAPWTGFSRRDTLTFFDQAGMPVRRVSVSPVSPEAAAAWRKQLLAWVAAERNHPSVFAWSLKGGTAAELREAAAAVAALDPTRPVLVDGTPAAVRDVSLPTPLGPASVVGASLLVRHREEVRTLVGKLRGEGVGGFQLDTVTEPDAVWQPVAVVCREGDAPLPAGETVRRTLAVVNDTRDATPLTVHWLLQTRRPAKVVQVRGKRTVTVPAGGAEAFGVEIAVPAGGGDADFVLSCERGGRTVFLDARRVTIVAR